MLGCMSYHLIYFYGSNPCLQIQVTMFRFQQLKGLGLSSAKSDLKHDFEEICCWSTRLCGQIAVASRPPRLRVFSLLQFPVACAVNTDNANGPLCFIREICLDDKRTLARQRSKRKLYFKMIYSKVTLTKNVLRKRLGLSNTTWLFRLQQQYSESWRTEFVLTEDLGLQSDTKTDIKNKQKMAMVRNTQICKHRCKFLFIVSTEGGDGVAFKILQIYIQLDGSLSKYDKSVLWAFSHEKKKKKSTTVVKKLNIKRIIL